MLTAINTIKKECTLPVAAPYMDAIVSEYTKRIGKVSKGRALNELQALFSGNYSKHLLFTVHPKYISITDARGLAETKLIFT